MRIKILLMAVVLTGLLFCLSASAKLTAEECGIVPITPFNYITTTDIPKFDQTLGELKSVKLTVRDACGFISTEIDSEDPLPRLYTFNFGGIVIPNLPIIGEKEFVIETPEEGISFAAAADDEPGKGNPDWAGLDYTLMQVGTEAVPVCAAPQQYSYDTDAEKAPFIGNEGEKLTIPVRTDSYFSGRGGNEYAIKGATSMGITICVVYEYEPFCINGTKFDDCTGDALPGWEIQLKNAAGTVIDTETTDADGKYSFCDLVSGSYTVCEVLEAGWKNVTATCIPVNVDDENVVDVNFRNTPLLCIEGFKYNSIDNSGLEGWTIELKNAAGTVIDTETTDATGKYSFCDLLSGTYTVCEVMKAGWTNETATCVPVTLDCVNVENVNFENTPLLCIEGSKINDCTEEGLPGWTIELKDSSGAVIDTAVTGANGEYSFCELLPGNYEVCETPQAGWTAVGPTCIPVTLVDGDFQGVDFRNKPLLCIEGFKFNSDDNSGLPGWTINLQDASGAQIATTTTGADGSYQFCNLLSGTYTVCEVMKDGWKNVTPTCVPVTLDCVDEADVNFENEIIPPPLCINGTKTNACTDEGLPGWTIELKDANGAVIKTAVTGANGEYSFCELESGTYTVCEVEQTGWKNVGDTCIPVTLVDESAEDVSFANEPPTSISGNKYNDTTEEGLSGWTIELKDAAGTVIDTETTDADGYYEFSGLFSGTYTVCEVMKKDWTAVGPTCHTVTLDCGPSEGNDFRNKFFVPPPHYRTCPWYLKGESYRAPCGVTFEVDASHGVLYNDRIGATVINPELITIDPKYGTIEVNADGSFVFEPAPNLPKRTTSTVSFKYGATTNDGYCDSTGEATATITIRC